MSRWIESENAMFRMLCCGTYHGVIAFDTVKSVINDVPSIDIVRCKECIHNPWNEDCDYTCIWDDDFANRPQTPNDFCSYGEREDE